MGSLKDQLNDYLTKSSGNTSQDTQDGGTSGYLSWMTGKKESAEIDETSNGWFSEAQNDPCLPSLSKKQRVLGFTGCILMGTLCFCLASLYLPFLILKARKFAMLYSLGSFFIIASFSLLWGPMNHIKHLFSKDRIPFTAVYFGTMFATIYFSVWYKSTVFTVIFAVAQIGALVWYIVSYIPGGNTGLKFFSKIFYAAASKTVQKTLPV